MSRKAIAVVGFGVGDIQVKEKCIDSILSDLQEAYGAEYDIYEAWTSKFLMKKMAKEGYVFPDFGQLMSMLLEKAYTHVVVMPTHLTPGEEWQKKIQPVLDEYADSFQRLEAMEPVLTAKSPEDFLQLSQDMSEVFDLGSLKDGEELVLMGHGSPNHHNVVYDNLQEFADQRNLPVHIGVVEDEDHPNQADVLQRLKEKGIKKVYLRPLLLAGGNHATYDLAGDQEDSWKNVLANAGMEVRYSTMGLGEYPGYRELYVKKLSKIIKNI